MADCIEYDEDSSLIRYKAICKTCDTGKYVSQVDGIYNECRDIPESGNGEINEFCSDYLDNEGCVNCLPGYGLIDI